MSKLAPSASLSEWHDSSARIADILGAPVVTGSGADSTRVDARRRIRRQRSIA
jgi:hypothetical protein